VTDFAQALNDIQMIVARVARPLIQAEEVLESIVQAETAAFNAEAVRQRAEGALVALTAERTEITGQITSLIQQRDQMRRDSEHEMQAMDAARLTALREMDAQTAARHSELQASLASTVQELAETTRLLDVARTQVRDAEHELRGVEQTIEEFRSQLGRAIRR
jgi:chromosome segregation ATPase